MHLKPGDLVKLKSLDSVYQGRSISSNDYDGEFETYDELEGLYGIVKEVDFKCKVQFKKEKDGTYWYCVRHRLEKVPKLERKIEKFEDEE